MSGKGVQEKKAVQKVLEDLIKNVVSNRDGVTAEYRPTLEHLRRFVEITGDENPIHKPFLDGALEGMAVSPGLLQSCIATLLIREAMRRRGLNPTDYSLSDNKEEMILPIVTGLEYRFKTSGTLESNFKTEIINESGNVVYKNTKSFFPPNDAIQSFFPQKDGMKEVYEAKIDLREGNSAPLKFGNLIGSRSRESNLFLLALSSSGVYKAIRLGKLNPLPEEVVALYRDVQIILDAGKSRDIDGAELKVYVPESRIDENITEKSEPVKMIVEAYGKEGSPVYSLRSNLAFCQKRLLEISMEREVRRAERAARAKS